MSQVSENNSSESICSNADGFCFTSASEGVQEIIVSGPVTAIPAELVPDISAEEAGQLFRIVYPYSPELSVFTELIPELHTGILTGISAGAATAIAAHPELSVHSFLTNMLHRMNRAGNGILAVIMGEGRTDIAATKGDRLLFLNTFHDRERFGTLYHILKVWKHVSFHPAHDSIWIAGCTDPDGDMLRNLKLMTGEKTICVL